MWNLNSDDQVQPDWRALATDLERRVDLLAGSLEEIRALVHRMAVEAPRAGREVPVAGTTAVAVEEPQVAPEYTEYKEPPPLPPVDAGWTRPNTWNGAARPNVSPADAAWQTDNWPAPPPAPELPIEEPVAVVEPEVPAIDPYEEEREHVRRAVAQLRAELDGTDLIDDLDAPPAQEIVLQESAVEDMDAVREEVRRAVAAARAEIDAVRSEADFVETEAETPKLMDTWAQAAAEARIPMADLPSEQSPPVYERPETKEIAASSIVIEDSNGRVELVRVYDALARVECADQALLLNYTPHSITVGLGLAPLPSKDALRKAVSEVFERTCNVEIEAGRASVTLTNGQYRAA